MTDEMERLTDFDGRRFMLENGWAVEFRIRLVKSSMGRPYGIKYSLVLRDADGKRIMGYDNAHGTPKQIVWDHRHRFRQVEDLVPYHFIDGDTLISDFFMALEAACKTEGVRFAFTDEDTVLDADDWGD